MRFVKVTRDQLLEIAAGWGPLQAAAVLVRTAAQRSWWEEELAETEAAVYSLEESLLPPPAVRASLVDDEQTARARLRAGPRPWDVPLYEVVDALTGDEWLEGLGDLPEAGMVRIDGYDYVGSRYPTHEDGSRRAWGHAAYREESPLERLLLSLAPSFNGGRSTLLGAVVGVVEDGVLGLRLPGRPAWEENAALALSTRLGCRVVPAGRCVDHDDCKEDPGLARACWLSSGKG